MVIIMLFTMINVLENLLWNRNFSFCFFLCSIIHLMLIHLRLFVLQTKKNFDAGSRTLSMNPSTVAVPNHSRACVVPSITMAFLLFSLKGVVI